MPLITLTSDIGSPDYLVGAIKAQLLSINPEFQLVDISHNVAPFHLPQAAYVCRAAIRQFPEHSFHLILVSLFENKPEQLLLAYHEGQYLLCADNGLLGMILEAEPEMIIGLPLDPEEDKNTLYLTRVMGETVHKLARGVAIQQLGNAEVRYTEKRHLRPAVDHKYIEGQIIFIDSFENVVVNITRGDFETQRQGRPFKIIFKRDEVIDRISESYADVREGEKLALFNSAGYLEIAINKGNAAGLFGLMGFSEKSRQAQLAYQTVKVHFGD